MPLDAAFLADCPYLPHAVFIDELLTVDPEQQLVRARMPTDIPLPIIDGQRVHPVKHPAHVPGAVMIHVTGILGFLHAYHLLGLRTADGWTGYGARIHDASFRSLARLGRPLILECRSKQVRRRDRLVVARYDFRFTQDDVVVYEGDQGAIFTRFDTE